MQYRSIRDISTERYELSVPSEVYLPTRPSGTCPPKFYKLLRRNFEFLQTRQ